MNKLDPSASVLKELILVFGSWPFSDIQICKDVIGGPLQQNNGQQNDGSAARSLRAHGQITKMLAWCDHGFMDISAMALKTATGWIGFC